jgi:hypothetical protein
LSLSSESFALHPVPEHKEEMRSESVRKFEGKRPIKSTTYRLEDDIITSIVKSE